MRLDHIFESPAEDLMHRGHARRLYDQIVDELVMNGLKEFKFNSQHNAYAKRFDRFILVLAKGKAGEGGLSKDGKYLWVFVKDPHNPLESLSRPDVKRAVVHELIHARDHERAKNLPSAPAPMRQEEDSWVDYYNHPSEFNAFYQEALSVLDDMIERRGFDFYKARWSNIQTFMSDVQHLFDKSFIESLSERNRRALLKRLYKHWNEILTNEG